VDLQGGDGRGGGGDKTSGGGEITSVPSNECGAGGNPWVLLSIYVGIFVPQRAAWLGARSVLIFLKGSRSSKRLTHGSNVNFSELNFASFKYLATRVQKIQRKIFLRR
jgi:hypothetical protein